ncbi:MAG TPA: xanthine dehydrogenase family protein subunit M [Micromonosporaceae bacterium]|nr:xanthine dehydrogenase family protein subunit M [Micromonosporaceae bacterium]
MDFVQPTTLTEALEARAGLPDGIPVAGGTDVMVDLNLHRRSPPALLDLSRVSDLAGVSTQDGWLRLGATVTYDRLMTALRYDLPALALAARSVGSPQVRHRGTLGGNLGTASPAGDAHPPLLAAGAEVEAVSTAGTRRIAVADFFVGPKRNVLAPGELIRAVHVPRARGPQQFAKVGPRNAMVVAVCSLALALHPDRLRVGTGIGSAGPVPLRATDAERFLEGVLGEGGLWEAPRPLDIAVRSRFADLVASAARPIDDVRGTAAYRVHALRVLAGRLLDRVWESYEKAGPR